MATKASQTGPIGPSLGVAEFAALVEATRAIAEVLEVETVLQLIVESVRNLVQAEYAALGIVDSSGRIERFITVGVSPDVRARIQDALRRWETTTAPR